MLTYWALIPLLALFANAAVVPYVLFVDPRHPANRMLALLCATLGFWATFNVIMHVLTDPASANVAIRISAPAWVMVAPLVLHFVLVVVRDRPLLRDYPAFGLVYAAGVPFILLRWFTESIYTDTPVLRRWGFQEVPGPLFPVYGGYVLLLTVAAVAVLFLRAKRTRNALERRRLLCVACGTAIPACGAWVTIIVLPLWGIRTYYSALGLTTVSAALFAFGIVRYRMFHPTLMHSARQVLQSMSQPVLLLTREGRVLEANDAAHAMTGRSAKSLFGLSITEFLSEGQAAWQALLGERDANGQTSNREITWVDDHGQPVPLLVSLTTLQNADHDEEGYLLLGSDYREMKHAREALEESEKLYRTLYENSMQGVVLVWETIRQANKQAADLVGMKPEELAGRPVTEFWPERQPDGRPSLEISKELIDGALAGEPQTFPWRVRRADGAVFDCDMSMNVVRVGGERLLQMTMRDITEERRLEDAIQYLHQATADVVGEAFFAALPQHLAQWLGMSRAHILELRPGDPDTGYLLAGWALDGKGLENSFLLPNSPCARVVTEGFLYLPSGASARFPDAQQLQLLEVESYVGMPLTNPDGRVIGIMCAMHTEPMTFQRHLVEALFTLFASRASAELARLHAEQQDREHAAHLRDMQKNESIALLAGGIAHDFNNILVGVLGHASLARDYVAPDSPAQRSLQVIEDSAERAAGLTNQLLAYARGGEGNPEPVNLRSVVTNLLDMLEAVLPKAVKVQCILPENVPGVLADPTQMQQVVMNLCTNAGEAMGDDGGTLTVTLDIEAGPAHCARPGGPSVDEQLVLTVSDTGCGMDPETQMRIFEPFYSTKEFGRGLGLSAVLGIATNHGGCVHCDSTPGDGTTFRVYLPAHSLPDAVGEPHAPSGPAPGGTETILLVDDEELVACFAQDVLSRLGYHVLSASDGDEAIQMYREHADEIDLVLLDMLMPGRNGLQTLQVLRDLDPEVKAILSSGYGLEQLPASHTGAHPTAFLKKPYRTRALADAVRAALAA